MNGGLMRSQRQVLLVGSRMAGPSFVHGLRRWGCQCTRTETLAEAIRALEKKPYALVLAQVDVEDGSGSALIGPVAEYGGDLFLCMAVEDSCLWLPAVRNGRNCWGAGALRPGEFKRQLASTVRHEVSSERLSRAILSPTSPG
jgi:hypothetical protein